jgi:hypothetical protein
MSVEMVQYPKAVWEAEVIACELQIEFRKIENVAGTSRSDFEAARKRMISAHDDHARAVIAADAAMKAEAAEGSYCGSGSAKTTNEIATRSVTVDSNEAMLNLKLSVHEIGLIIAAQKSRIHDLQCLEKNFAATASRLNEFMAENERLTKSLKESETRLADLKQRISASNFGLDKSTLPPDIEFLGVVCDKCNITGKILDDSDIGDLFHAIRVMVKRHREVCDENRRLADQRDALRQQIEKNQPALNPPESVVAAMKGPYRVSTYGIGFGLYGAENHCILVDSIRERIEAVCYCLNAVWEIMQGKKRAEKPEET